MTKRSPYKVGDVVQLKSGGPKMTVTEVITSYTTEQWTGSVRTSWFAGAKHEHATFDAEALLVPPPEEAKKGK